MKKAEKMKHYYCAWCGQIIGDNKDGEKILKDGVKQIGNFLYCSKCSTKIK